MRPPLLRHVVVIPGVEHQDQRYTGSGDTGEPPAVVEPEPFIAAAAGTQSSVSGATRLPAGQRAGK